MEELPEVVTIAAEGRRRALAHLAIQIELLGRLFKGREWALRTRGFPVDGFGTARAFGRDRFLGPASGLIPFLRCFCLGLLVPVGRQRGLRRE
jgi:hypothetical protein